ncbi:hypothetical protein NDU88_007478 [Pleurodeles waltl]|uniref:Uncharacterized protein n=1 Tax=Pleurodeles waltl TaxID=8319 RepID=A0AAV7SSW1_PLEWA|nr:hypothetical protein NDU88_007478 [Pleurodeles waltl]
MTAEWVNAPARIVWGTTQPFILRSGRNNYIPSKTQARSSWRYAETTAFDSTRDNQAARGFKALGGCEYSGISGEHRHEVFSVAHPTEGLPTEMMKHIRVISQPRPENSCAEPVPEQRERPPGREALNLDPPSPESRKEGTLPRSSTRREPKTLTFTSENVPQNRELAPAESRTPESRNERHKTQNPSA